MTITQNWFSGLGNESTSVELTGAVETDRTVDMAHSSEQSELMPQPLQPSERERSTEDSNFEMRTSFSWDRSFFTSDGFLDDEELSSMIEGDGKDVKHQLQGLEEIEILEAKLFEEIEASTQKASGTSNPTNSSIKVSSGERDSQAKASSFSPKGTRATKTQASKSIGPIILQRAVSTSSLSSLGSSTAIKTEPTQSSTLSGGSGSSPGNNVKSSATLARRSTSSKTGKATTGSPSKTPPAITTKNKVPPVNSRLPSHLVFSNLSPTTSPASPISPGSSGSPSSSNSVVNQRSSRASSAPHRSSPTNARRKDDQKIGSISKTPLSISLKNKPPPVNSHPSSPLGLFNSSPSTSLASSTIQQPSESSSSTCTVDQRSTSRGTRGTSVHHRSLHHDASAKSSLKNHPTGQTPSVQSMGRGMPSPKIGFFEEGKSYKCLLLDGLPEAGATQHSKSGAKARTLQRPKTVAGSKPNSPKTSTQKQSNSRAKPSSRSIVLISPEVLDIKGKINALKMEISMQKKEKYKETKMSPAESGKWKDLA